jgi:hypothetical protein
LAVAGAVCLAILVPPLLMDLHLGLNQAQFAAQGDMTLRAAPPLRDLGPNLFRPA